MGWVVEAELLGLLMKLLYLVVQLGTKCVLPSPALSLIEHTQVLFLGRIFHKFLSTVDLAHFLAHALVVFGDVGMAIIIKS